MFGCHNAIDACSDKKCQTKKGSNNSVFSLNICVADIARGLSTYTGTFINVSYFLINSSSCLFSFILSEDNNNLGFYIETRLINKAIKVNTKVDKNYINSNYVLTSFNYLESNKEKITNALKNINVNNRTIFTMNNLLSEYKNVITLSYYKDNQYELLINYLKSLVLLFDTDLDLFKSKCPICGQNEINFDGFDYHCKNCRSTFSFNETVKGPLMWIKNMRRDY